MTRLHLRRLPAAALAATVVLELVAVGLSWGLEPRYDTLLYASQTVVFAGAGALIWSRHPENRIGVLLCLVTGVVNAAAADLAQGWSLRGWAGADVAEAIALTSWLTQAPAITTAILLFPTGRTLRPAWRIAAWTSVLGATLALPGFLLAPRSGSYFEDGTNPYAVDGFPGDALFGLGTSLVLVALVASVLPLVQRFGRSTGVERQQLKWFALAAGVAVVVLPAGVVLWNVAPVVRLFVALALTGLPAAMCVAILRYRLYDIDLVINQTLVYAAVTITLATTYGLTAVGVGALAGRGSAWPTAAATLVAAVAFRPARDALQHAVDRRFDRSRYDAVRQVRAFLEDLRTGRAEPEEIEAVLRRAVGDPSLELRLLLPGATAHVDLHGEPVTDDPAEATWPIRRRGVTLGAVALGAEVDRAISHLPTLVDAGALAVEIVRLRVELRRQLDEVAASRARLAAAAEDERRRIERDLHDGAQQRLVSIGLSLRHAQHALGDASPHVSATLDGAVGEISVAIDELRELARGLRPVQLDAGLAPALRELARRAPLPVDVRAPATRFPDDVEAAAYFTACEAVTNAVKHARATRILVRALAEHDRLVIAVHDDGIGGASANGGSGLTGLRDRVAAQGGTLVVDSPVGAGTTLTAEFPCGS